MTNDSGPHVAPDYKALHRTAEVRISHILA